MTEEISKTAEVNREPWLALIEGLKELNYANVKPLPDNELWVNRIQIEGDSGRPYILSQRREQATDRTKWACSCKGWVSYRHCKHTKDVANVLGFKAEGE